MTATQLSPVESETVSEEITEKPIPVFNHEPLGLLKDKVVVVTGASRGIGQSICNVFAREGATVAFNYGKNDEGAAKTIEMIESHGQKGKAYKISVTDNSGLKEMVKDVIEEYGRIDVLVNNAAINKGNSFMTMPEDAWHEVMDVNINSLFHVTKPIFRHMMKRRQGKILNISSIAAIRCLPTAVHYSTSKAAMVGFTKGLSREGAQFGIQVNCIAAGIYETDLGLSLPGKFHTIYKEWCPMNRLGDPSELAEVAAFMVSDRNSYMNGDVITIDGGTID